MPTRPVQNDESTASNEEAEPPSTNQGIPLLRIVGEDVPSEMPLGTEDGQSHSNILTLFSKDGQPGSVFARKSLGVPVRASARSKAFMRRYFPEATQQDWDDWRWQIRNRISSGDKLRQILNLSAEEEAALSNKTQTLPLGITPYYASLLDANNPEQPVRRSVVPTSHELIESPGEAKDPLGEDGHSPVHGLVHRYPDRVLFLVSSYCSTYCRYCTRSRMVGDSTDFHSTVKQWSQAIDYIRAHKEVRDVLISGGDPLTLSDEKIEWLLRELRSIEHVEFLRIGTKVPVVLPQRITKNLTRILKRYHPLWMSIHFTHPEELSAETVQACERLADAGIPLGSQTVLLKGINDKVETMKSLYHGLLKCRVRPYYIYQCDPISGSSHFRTSVEKGLEIIQGLRGHTSGYAVPHFVIDAPGGGGKIPLLPDYVVGREGNDLVLKNYEGNLYRYPDPQ